MHKQSKFSHTLKGMPRYPAREEESVGEPTTLWDAAAPVADPGQMAAAVDEEDVGTEPYEEGFDGLGEEAQPGEPMPPVPEWPEDWPTAPGDIGRFSADEENPPPSPLATPVPEDFIVNEYWERKRHETNPQDVPESPVLDDGDGAQAVADALEAEKDQEQLKLDRLAYTEAHESSPEPESARVPDWRQMKKPLLATARKTPPWRESNAAFAARRRRSVPAGGRLRSHTPKPPPPPAPPLQRLVPNTPKLVPPPPRPPKAPAGPPPSKVLIAHALQQEKSGVQEGDGNPPKAMDPKNKARPPLKRQREKGPPPPISHLSGGQREAAPSSSSYETVTRPVFVPDTMVKTITEGYWKWRGGDDE